MLILPESWPDENLYSLLAKIARVNGLGPLQVIRLLFGEKHPISVFGCPVNIKHFCEVTKDAYGSPKDLLRHGTVFPALAHLGDISDSTLSQVENGATRPELGILAFGMTRGCHWRVCRDCVERDVKIYGISYWHRVHQLPTNQYCTEHGLMLDRLDLRSVQLLDNLVLPHDVCNKAELRTFPAVLESSSICFDISILGCDVLADNSEPFSKEVIQATFEAGLAQMGLLTGIGKISLTEYYDEFSRKFGVEASTTTLLRHSKVSNPIQLLFGITDERTCKPFARLMLVYWLFGTWGAFKEQCLWQDVFYDDFEGEYVGYTPSLNEMKDALAETMLQQKRQVCLDYKASRVNPTRYEFLRESYRAFRWLRHNDCSWLDEELPLLPKGKGQRGLFD